MSNKPQHISGYDRSTTAAVRQLCLLVATRLNDLLPLIRIVGGLVPSLLIESADQDSAEAHVGTLDLDIALQISVLDNSRYHEISDRLRGAGFFNDESSTGQPTRQRWRDPNGLKIDFLIPPASESPGPGHLQSLESDFAAIVTPGLEMAFEEYEMIEIDGSLLSGEFVSRKIWVCGPGAFVLLKALAFRNRGEPKDAYDLHYFLQHWPRGLPDIASRIRSLSHNPHSKTALEYLSEDFESIDSMGPGYVDRFIHGDGSNDENLKADAVGMVKELCRLVGEPPSP